MEGYEKNRVKVTPEHVFYVIKFRKLANFGGQYLPFHCKGPHLREFRLKFDIKSFISKRQRWKFLGATLAKLRQSDPRKRRFWTVFRKFSKKISNFFLASSRHFWCLQMPYFGNFCTTPSLAAGPVWNSPYIFFGQISNPPKPPWGGGGVEIF